MRVELVLTEPRRELTEARAANYERLAGRLRAASGLSVRSTFYEDVEPERLRDAHAIVLSGSSAPWSSHDDDALGRLGEAVLAAERPVLGICAGLQLQVRFAGGVVGPSSRPEHGFLPIEVHERDGLFRELPERVVVYHDHGDEVVDLPESFRVLASSDACAVQAVVDSARSWWGTQFHPEEFEDDHPAGARVLRNFFGLL
jgi:GMP synthase (glutamine-hydrolysing)